eukprot:comp20482_c0_seq1/m.26134 comp20482_c0_seq1/g.26134  ORF comp20482_c0_seq1/g.26134 comp20482_c0_seq1/m.26134 type:complete len:270 (-) comp20482_c0_seq1:90-899(-)
MLDVFESPVRAKPGNMARRKSLSDLLSPLDRVKAKEKKPSSVEDLTAPFRRLSFKGTLSLQRSESANSKPSKYTLPAISQAVVLLNNMTQDERELYLAAQAKNDPDVASSSDQQQPPLGDVPLQSFADHPQSLRSYSDSCVVGIRERALLAHQRDMQGTRASRHSVAFCELVHVGSTFPNKHYDRRYRHKYRSRRDIDRIKEELTAVNKELFGEFDPFAANISANVGQPHPVEPLELTGGEEAVVGSESELEVACEEDDHSDSRMPSQS